MARNHSCANGVCVCAFVCVCASVSPYLAAHIVVPIPWDVPLVQLPCDVPWQTLELSEWVLGAPLSVVHHLTQGEGALGEASPPALETDLKQTPHETTRALQGKEEGMQKHTHTHTQAHTQVHNKHVQTPCASER